MVAKITRGQKSLTDEQHAYAVSFALERINSILSPGVTDENEKSAEKSAEEHLRQAYRAAGLEPPRTIRWFDSPLGLAIAKNPSVGASVWDSVGASVRASVGASVWDSVRASVWDSVRASVRASVGASVWDSVGASVGGLWDQDDCAFLWFFNDMFEENPFIHFAKFNDCVHGYFLGSTEAWLVRKAVRLERDDRGRLHSDSGMCIQYADGWGFYAWHGVRIPEQIIMHPDQLTRDDWMNESNMEIRRCMQERLGPDQFVALVGSKSIHSDECGELIEVDLGSDPERIARYVHVKDASTDREYYLRVPPVIERARQGIAWTFDIPEAEYCPLVQA